MGFFGDLFGGGGDNGYDPLHPEDYDNLSYERIKQRLGANSNPVTGAEGVKAATQGYDFSPMNKAVKDLSSTPTLTQTYKGSTYKPSQFNFAQLPEQYAQTAYASGSQPIKRQGQDNLQMLGERMGSRRPGLFAKVAQQNQRETNTNLGNLNNQIQLEKIRQNVDLGRAQQEAQAGENLNAAGFNADQSYRGYQSRSDLEKSNSANKLSYANALGGMGQNVIGTKSGLVENERNYQDKALEYLMNLFSTSVSGANQAGQLMNQKRGQTLDFMGKMAGAAAPGFTKMASNLSK